MLKYLLLSVLVFQTVNSANTVDFYGGNFNDIVGQIQAFFTNAATNVAQLLKNATNNISNLLDKANKQLEAQIQKLRETIKQIGDNVACGSVQSEKIVVLSKKIRTGMEECWTKAKNANTATAQLYDKYRKDSEDRLKPLRAIFNDCGLIVRCRAEALGNILRERILIVEGLPGVLQNILSGFAKNAEAYRKCLDDNYEANAIELNVIKADIIKCIAD